MATQLKLYQGEDKTIIVTTNIDLSAAIEIEFRIDTPTQIIKKLTAGQITGVNATQFNVAIAAGDTESIAAGPYKYQVVSTDSGGAKSNGKFSPNKVEILDSIFTDEGSGNDYN